MKSLAVWTPVVGAALLAPFVFSAGCGGCECNMSVDVSWVQCSEHQRGLRTALMIYATDYDDVLPPANEWQDATFFYVGIYRNFYKCPEIEALGNPAQFGIAFNSAIGGIPINTISDPATPVTFDSTILTRNANSPTSTLPSPARHDRNVIVRFDGNVVSEPRPK